MIGGTSVGSQPLMSHQRKGRAAPDFLESSTKSAITLVGRLPIRSTDGKPGNGGGRPTEKRAECGANAAGSKFT
jgi:hypothetical protein